MRVTEHLRSPETDWDEVYIRIRMSSIGPDYPRERFLRTPVSTIKWLLSHIDTKEKAEANVRSITAARLADIVLQVAYGLAGSKNKTNTTAEDFLPFPHWQPNPTEREGPDMATRLILSDLVRRNQIPLHVYAALVTDADSAA